MADTNIEVQYKLNTQQALDSIKQLSDAYKALDTAMNNSGTNASNTLGKIATGAKGAKDGASAMTDLFSGFSGILKDLDAPMSAVFATDKIVEFGTAATNVFGGMSEIATTAVTVFEGSTAAIEGTTAVTKILNAAFEANPIGFVVGAVATLVGAFSAMNFKSDETIKREQEKAQLNQIISDGVDKAAGAYDGLSKSVGEYNNLSVEEKKNLEDKINSQLDSAKASLADADAHKEAVIQGDVANGKYKDLAESTKAYAKELQPLQDQIEKYTELAAKTKSASEIESGAMKMQGDSVLQLQSKISTLEQAHSQAKIGSEDFTRTQNELTDANAQLAIATGNQTEAQKKAVDAQQKANEASKTAKQNLQELRDISGKIKEDSTTNLSDKNDMARNGELKKLADNEKFAGLKNTQEYRDALAAINAKYDAGELKLAQDQAAKVTDSKKKEADLNRTNTDADYKEEMDFLKQQQDEKLKVLSDAFAKEDPLQKDYADKQKQFEDGKAKIHADGLNNQLQVTQIYGKDSTAIEQNIANNSIAINKDANAKKLADDKTAADKKKAFNDQELQLGKDLVSAAFSFEKDANDKALAQAQATHDAEIAALKNKGYTAQGLAVATAAADKKFADQSRDIKRKQAIADKELSLFNIAINTAETVVKIGTQMGVAAPPFQAIAIAEGLLQAALVAARPLPQFYKGVIDLPLGNNRRGRDTIPAMLHEGESVMTADETKKFKPVLLAMRSGALDKVPLNWGALNSHPTPLPPADKTMEAAVIKAVKLVLEEKNTDDRIFHLTNESTSTLRDMNKSLKTIAKQSITKKTAQP